MPEVSSVKKDRNWIERLKNSEKKKRQSVRKTILMEVPCKNSITTAVEVQKCIYQCIENVYSAGRRWISYVISVNKPISKTFERTEVINSHMHKMCPREPKHFYISANHFYSKNSRKLRFHVFLHFIPRKHLISSFYLKQKKFTKILWICSNLVWIPGDPQLEQNSQSPMNLIYFM